MSFSPTSTRGSQTVVCRGQGGFPTFGDLQLQEVEAEPGSGVVSCQSREGARRGRGEEPA